MLSFAKERVRHPHGPPSPLVPLLSIAHGHPRLMENVAELEFMPLNHVYHDSMHLNEHFKYNETLSKGPFLYNH